jgi:RNA recognition motif-containing protein
MKLLVRNLARTTTEAELKALFEEHGNVEYCTLVLDKVTGESKGFAFVEMPVKNEAKDAISKLNGTKIDKSKVRVKEAE